MLIWQVHVHWSSLWSWFWAVKACVFSFICVCEISGFKLNLLKANVSTSHYIERQGSTFFFTNGFISEFKRTTKNEKVFFFFFQQLHVVKNSLKIIYVHTLCLSYGYRIQALKPGIKPYARITLATTPHRLQYELRYSLIRTERTARDSKIPRDCTYSKWRVRLFISRH